MSEFISFPVIVGILAAAAGYAIGVLVGVLCERDRHRALADYARRKAAVQADAVSAAWAVRKAGEQ